ncbi:MAG: HEAT repeat domain-containing protein [Kiritimatiellae bacterium]|nr:HEAT repeat domain-containing protein [Kiritimatiellia bacterium]MDD5520273.1 HEAT repeat domain-containing protein [Kiritimatiellia bacterium]
MKNIMLILSICCFALTALRSENDPYAELSAYDAGPQTIALSLIEKEFREGGPAVYEQVEARLLAVLSKPESTYACKKFICETLGIVGSKACIEPMLKLLADEKTADMARTALERLPGKSFDKALLNALKSSSDRIRIGIIQSLATRHNAGLAGVLKGYLGSGDLELIQSSLQALARVGGTDAVKVLTSVRLADEFQPLRERALVDAAFNLARTGSNRKALKMFEQEYKNGTSLPAIIGAFNGLIDYGKDTLPVLTGVLKNEHKALALAAVKTSMRLSDPAVTKILIDVFPSVKPAVQLAIVRALAEREDVAGLPVIKIALTSQDEGVKGEAIVALEKLGDVSVVNDLATLAVDGGNLSAAAQQTLSRVRGPDVNDTLTKLLDDPDPKKVRVAAMALKLRDENSIIPRLLKMVESEKADTRSLAIEVLDGFAGENEIPELIRLLNKGAGSSDSDKVASIIWKATRMIDKDDDRFIKLWSDVGNCPEPVKLAILPYANSAGGAGSRKIVTDTIASGSDAMRDRAVRVLFSWQNDQAVKSILDLLKSTSNARYKILGMQALVRILNDRKCTLQPKQKIETLEQVLPLMERPEDKQNVHNTIEKVKSGK